MKSASSALSTAYKTLLTGLTYEGQSVGVFSGMAPGNAVAPYVIIGAWQPRSDNTKTRFGQKGELNLDVVTRSEGEGFSKKAARDIANLISELVKPTPTSEVLPVAGFNCYCTVIEAQDELMPPSDTDKIFRVILSISHQLDQL